MMYEVLFSVPYEGGSWEAFGSLQEVQQWLKDNRSRYDYDLDRVKINEIGKGFNPFDVIQGKF